MAIAELLYHMMRGPFNNDLNGIFSRSRIGSKQGGGYRMLHSVNETLATT